MRIQCKNQCQKKHLTRGQHRFLHVLEIDNDSVSVDNKLDSHQQALPLHRFHRTGKWPPSEKTVQILLSKSKIHRAGAPSGTVPQQSRGTKLKLCFVFCREARPGGSRGHESRPLTEGQGDPAAGRCGVWTRVAQPLPWQHAFCPGAGFSVNTTIIIRKHSQTFIIPHLNTKNPQPYHRSSGFSQPVTLVWSPTSVLEPRSAQRLPLNCLLTPKHKRVQVRLTNPNTLS